MKNKILIGAGLVAVFLLTMNAFHDVYINSETLGQILGLGALVLSYFAGRVVKINSNKAD